MESQIKSAMEKDPFLRTIFLLHRQRQELGYPPTTFRLSGEQLCRPPELSDIRHIGVTSTGNASEKYELQQRSKRTSRELIVDVYKAMRTSS